ncbi:MAG: tetratricopeptide repeat protein [Planctomycetota bacterium]|nr:tetratricopeptide repeat protein [Planctomycetota bacterium]
MKLVTAVVASLVLMNLAALAQAEPTNLDEQIMAILETESQPGDEAAPEAAAPEATAQAAPTSVVTVKSAPVTVTAVTAKAVPMPMPSPAGAPAPGPQAIMAAVANPTVSGFMAVGKLKAMADDAKTRQGALEALESVAQEGSDPAIQRAALFVLADAYLAQGQGDRAARVLARIGRSVTAPMPMPFHVPFPCPLGGGVSETAGAPCPMMPPPGAIAVSSGQAHASVPPPAAPKADNAQAEAAHKLWMERQAKLREIQTQIEQKEHQLRELSAKVQAAATAKPAPGQAAAEDALRAKRLEAQVLEAKVAELQKVLVGLQDKVKKTQADAADQGDRAQKLQAQQARLEKMSQTLEQWEQRLKQWEEKVNKASQEQAKPKAPDEEDEDK